MNVWQRVAGYCRVLPPIEKWTGQTLVGVNGSALSVKGVAGLPLSLEGNAFNVPFVVTDDILHKPPLYGCLELRRLQLITVD